MTTIEIPSLNNISNKLYELINNDINESKDINIFKNMINDYYDDINNKKKILDEKELYYNTNINNPRIVQNELYNKYITEREELYNLWTNNKNIDTFNQLSKFEKFNYIYIPDIYTYNFEINNNFGKKLKEKFTNTKQNEDFSDIEEVKEEKDHVSDIEEVKEEKDDVSDIEEVKEEIKKSKTLPKQENDKCTEKKINLCKKNKTKKYCNPVTGECDKTPPPSKEEIEKSKTPLPPKEEQVKSKTPLPPKEEKDLCPEKKKQECISKGKICNPDSGRCVAKLKKKIN
tara:strand:- start:1402 stop:2262 length:861 start_codon:yes stop_codon:yes gene_type:complete